MARKTVNRGCPCDSGKTYDDCCGPFHGGVAAVAAEALMRSRYSAYVLGLADYLRATWHPTTCPAELDLAGGPKWLGLSVLRYERIGPDSAVVEFVARYKAGGRAGRMHETSRFVCENGIWYYLDGAVGG